MVGFHGGGIYLGINQVEGTVVTVAVSRIVWGEVGTARSGIAGVV